MLLSLLAGAMIPLGGWLASRGNPRGDRIPHAVVAFGGGALISAVALVLVPDGAGKLPAPLAVGLFGLGGVAFAALDRLVARRGGKHGQMLAMLSDFIPEAAALGALLATGAQSAVLLAVLIGMQNLPEGFNAWREAAPTRPRRTMAMFCGLALFGPVAALAGHALLSAHDAWLGAMMVFAAGGILYLVFEDVAPAGHADKEWVPQLGAVLGFAFGLAGDLLVG